MAYVRSVPSGRLLPVNIANDNNTFGTVGKDSTLLGLNVSLKLANNFVALSSYSSGVNAGQTELSSNNQPLLLSKGGANKLVLDTNEAIFVLPTVRYHQSVTSPTLGVTGVPGATTEWLLYGQDTSGNFTAGKVRIRGGRALGGSGTGGSVDIGPGLGPTLGRGNLVDGNDIPILSWNAVGLGFYGTAPTAKPTVTGSRASGAALADLLTKLALLGLIVDGTSA